MKKITQKLLPYICIEDIPEDYRALAKDIGIDNLLKVACSLGGCTLYIPKEEYFTKNIRDNIIKREFDGYNYKALATKYGLSETWVRKILKG